jgi:LacI family transcriptional regulator
MTNKAACLKDIAYELKISINTVSRALRDCDDISDSTKEKVRQKAYELGYLPNSVSQFIKRDNRKLIAVIINSFNNPYFSIVCEKLVNIFNEGGYDFTIVYSFSKKFNLDTLKQCISQRADGIITLLEPDDDVVDNAKLNKLPIVLIGRNIDKYFIDTVYTDDEIGGQLVANYLVNYHSIDKFIYIKMPNAECSKRRQKAFEDTVKKLNSHSDILIFEPKQINDSLINYINQGYLGIFCFNDELVYLVLKYLNGGIPNVRKVYPHLHIVGYDCLNTRMSGLMDITSVDFDYDGICKKAIDIMNDRFANINAPKKSVMFPVKLHQRHIF